MAVVGMVGVSFVGPSEEIEQVARFLLRSENFEPMSPEVMMGGSPLGSRFQRFKNNRYDGLLEKLERLWEMAGFSLPEKTADVRGAALPFETLESQTNLLVQAMEEWRRKAEALSTEYDTWRAMLEFGEVVRATGRKLGDLPLEPYGSLSIGSLSLENWRRLKETSLASPFLALPLIEDRDRVTAIIFYGQDYREEIHKIFLSVHLRLLPIRPEEYVHYENADAIRYRMESLGSEIQNLKDMPRRYAAENRFDLEKLYEAAYTMQRVHALCRKRAELSGLWVLSGWIPQRDYAAVVRTAEERASHVLVLSESGDALEKQGNELPTLLSNLPLIRRFQEIVRLYSLPSYSELDPTFVVAVSFCLFFGFMFGDIGHGLALILGTHFMEKKGLMGGAIASVMKVAGLASVAFGFLYGSFFGNEELFPPLWLSPMHDVNTLLPTAVGVGVAFLAIGSLFRIQNCIRKGQWGEALFSPEGLVGLLFYGLALLQAVIVMGPTPEIALGTHLFGAVMLLLFVVMIFGNGIAQYLCRGERVDEGGAVHVFSVFHALMNFVSNTASFVRLAAFALNHAGLCTAVFMLGDMVDGLPGGRIFHTLVLAVGHLIIIGLEGMIVFIQTLRLEYYEFFGKFYHGGGREFRPTLWKKKVQA